MKKIIAIAAIIATAQASAFWGDSDGYNNGNGSFDTAGNAEGEATFSMNFSGKGRSDFRGNGNLTDSWNSGNNYHPYYYGAPVAPVAPAAPAAAK